jgi:hypothetical protein
MLTLVLLDCLSCAPAAAEDPRSLAARLLGPVYDPSSPYGIDTLSLPGALEGLFFYQQTQQDLGSYIEIL